MGPGPSLTSLCGAGWGGATELRLFWLPKVQEGKKKRMKEGRRAIDRSFVRSEKGNQVIG